MNFRFLLFFPLGLLAFSAFATQPQLWTHPRCWVEAKRGPGIDSPDVLVTKKAIYLHGPNLACSGFPKRGVSVFRLDHSGKIQSDFDLGPLTGIGGISTFTKMVEVNGLIYLKITLGGGFGYGSAEYLVAFKDQDSLTSNDVTVKRVYAFGDFVVLGDNDFVVTEVSYSAPLCGLYRETQGQIDRTFKDNWCKYVDPRLTSSIARVSYSPKSPFVFSWIKPDPNYGRRNWRFYRTFLDGTAAAFPESVSGSPVAAMPLSNGNTLLAGNFSEDAFNTLIIDPQGKVLPGSELDLPGAPDPMTAKFFEKDGLIYPNWVSARFDSEGHLDPSWPVTEGEILGIFEDGDVLEASERPTTMPGWSQGWARLDSKKVPRPDFLIPGRDWPHDPFQSMTQFGSAPLVAMKRTRDGGFLIARGGMHFSSKPIENYVLFKYRADGAIDERFRPVLGRGVPNGSTMAQSPSVTSLDADNRGRILIRGVYDFIHGIPVSEPIVRLNPDGTLDTNFAPGLKGAEILSAIATENGGVLVLTKRSFGSLPVLFKLSDDGSLDRDFAPWGSVQDLGNAIALRKDPRGDDFLILYFSYGKGAYVRRLLSSGEVESSVLSGDSWFAPGELAALNLLVQHKADFGGFEDDHARRYFEREVSEELLKDPVKAAPYLERLTPVEDGRVIFVGSFLQYKRLSVPGVVVMEGAGP